MTHSASGQPCALGILALVTALLCLLRLLPLRTQMICSAGGLIEADWLVASVRNGLQWTPVIRSGHCALADLYAITGDLSALSNLRIAFVGDSHVRNLHNVFLDLVLRDGCGPPRETMNCTQVNLASFYTPKCGQRARGWASSAAHFPHTASGAANISVSFTWAPRYTPFRNSSNCLPELSAWDRRYLAAQLTPACRTAPQIAEALLNVSDAVVLNWPQYELANALTKGVLLRLLASSHGPVFYNDFSEVAAFSSFLSQVRIPAIDLSGALIRPVMYDSAHAALLPVELAARFLLVQLLRKHGTAARQLRSTPRPVAIG